MQASALVWVSSLLGECIPRLAKGECNLDLLSSPAFDDRLEDDDFDLIEENLGVKVKRVSCVPMLLLMVWCVVAQGRWAPAWQEQTVTHISSCPLGKGELSA